MSKTCYFCGKKLSFLNVSYVNEKDVCDSCSQAYDLINVSTSAEELREKGAAMISRIQNNPEAVKLIEEKVNRFSKAFVMAEETERKRLEEERLQNERILTEENIRLEREKELNRIKEESADKFLNENGYEGYYEYKILNILDEKSGSVNVKELYEQLNTFGRQGWRLKCAFTNELGKNASSIGIAGVSLGTNSTQDQSILILERFIKFKS